VLALVLICRGIILTIKPTIEAGSPGGIAGFTFLVGETPMGYNSISIHLAFSHPIIDLKPTSKGPVTRRVAGFLFSSVIHFMTHQTAEN
jgi:hypothetical protein